MRVYRFEYDVVIRILIARISVVILEYRIAVRVNLRDNKRITFRPSVGSVIVHHLNRLTGAGLAFNLEILHTAYRCLGANLFVHVERIPASIVVVSVVIRNLRIIRAINLVDKIRLA
ncbi:hypothetical protein D3C75_945640 [compost metagenome]